jgi:signal transduction histidine kinase
VALDELLLAVYELQEPLARRKGLTLEIDEAQEASVSGDPLWLHQMVTNLVNNAIKYTPSGGRVALSLVQESAEAVLSIRDNGIGIPPEHLPFIFDRFYRVDAGRSRESGGTGLGLSIVQWVAETHGGRVEVESRPEKETRFTVRLPVPPTTEA